MGCQLKSVIETLGNGGSYASAGGNLDKGLDSRVSDKVHRATSYDHFYNQSYNNNDLT